MNLELILIVFLIVLTIVVIKYASSHKNDDQKRLRQGFLLIQHMQKVINQCQQHRGTSNAVLQGNANLKPQLIAIDRNIEALIIDGNKYGLKMFPQWDSFMEHWPRLKQHSLDRDLPSQNLIRQHNMMIEGQLSLLDDVIRHYHMHTVMFDRVSRMSGLCVDILRATEVVGRARAIGSGACAKGECEGVDKISLKFLRITLEASTNNLFSELDEIDNHELTANLSRASLAVKTSIDKLVNVLDNDILIDGKTRIASTEYFNISSKPIEQLLAVFGIIVSYGTSKDLRE